MLQFMDSPQFPRGDTMKNNKLLVYLCSLILGLALAGTGMAGEEKPELTKPDSVDGSGTPKPDSVDGSGTPKPDSVDGSGVPLSASVVEVAEAVECETLAASSGEEEEVCVAVEEEEAEE